MSNICDENCAVRMVQIGEECDSFIHQHLPCTETRTVLVMSAASEKFIRHAFEAFKEFLGTKDITFLFTLPLGVFAFSKKHLDSFFHDEHFKFMYIADTQKILIWTINEERNDDN